MRVIPILILFLLLAGCSDDDGIFPHCDQHCLCPGESYQEGFHLPDCPRDCCSPPVRPEPPEEVCCTVQVLTCQWHHCWYEDREVCCEYGGEYCPCDWLRDDEKPDLVWPGE